jgi:hypothetical protein
MKLLAASLFLATSLAEQILTPDSQIKPARSHDANSVTKLESEADVLHDEWEDWQLTEESKKDEN